MEGKGGLHMKRQRLQERVTAARRAFLQTAFGVLLAVIVFTVCGEPPQQAVWETALTVVLSAAGAAAIAFFSNSECGIRNAKL